MTAAFSPLPKWRSPELEVVGVVLPPLWHEGHKGRPMLRRTAAGTITPGPQQRVPGSGGRADEAHRESQGGRCQARWRRALWWEWAVILAPASSPPLGARPGLPGTGARGVSPAGAAGAIVAAIAGPTHSRDGCPPARPTHRLKKAYTYATVRLRRWLRFVGS
jgi:hypothetical protein